MDENSLETLLRKIIVEELMKLHLGAPSKYLTPKELCNQFKISRKTFYDWLHKGRFPMHKMGNRSYVILEEFEKGMHKVTL
jgi:excisionase family DNA binding protein